jgi:hypothetical protein
MLIGSVDHYVAEMSDDWAMALNRNGVVAAMIAHGGPLAAGHTVRASRLRGTPLWQACREDGGGIPYIGVGCFVGPDGRVWTTSSNPSIHDCDLAIRLLTAVYAQGLESYLSDDKFGDRLQTITQERAVAERQFIADVRGGAMRDQVDRRLP